MVAVTTTMPLGEMVTVVRMLGPFKTTATALEDEGELLRETVGLEDGVGEAEEAGEPPGPALVGVTVCG